MKQVKYQMRSLPLKSVKIDDSFWTPRQEVNRNVTLAAEYKMCKETGRIDAFRLKKHPEPHIFWDSDVAKWMEAAAYTLATDYDSEVDKLLTQVIDLAAAAQQSDGYLNTHFTVVEPDKRWTNLRDNHELYCAGHLIEAAVAYFEATGETRFLDVVCRYAAHIESTFGMEKGKKRGYCGHEEIELALVRLYRATGQKRYLKLAKYFIDERGRKPHYYDMEARNRGEEPASYCHKTYAYCQAHIPVREQSEVTGHAVRAMYLYCGMADVAAETNDATLLAACERLWEHACCKNLYITGGIGPSRHNEGFTWDYDLPNLTGYAETCAAIALVFFSQRMLQITGEARYADVVERALYNGTISGVSLDGTKFFYENPLASTGRHHRQEWFSCSCCPPNIARLLASLGSYVYSSSDDSIYVHQYISGQATASLAGGDVTISQRGNYPWDGKINLSLSFKLPAKFSLMLRLPGWCRKYSVKVNGKAVKPSAQKGYLKLNANWKNGDKILLDLAMPVERMAAAAEVTADAGKIALQRGPVVYCLEQCDNKGQVLAMRLPDRAKLAAKFDSRLMGGMGVIEGTAVAPAGKSNGSLYMPLEEASFKQVKFRAVPYFAWDNRKQGPMTVWLPRA